MRIAVFGAGGVGGYFGGRLAQAGEEVTFIARGEHLTAIQKNGLRVESVAGDFVIQPAQATENPAAAGEVEVVIVAVKAWQVPEAAELMRPMIGADTFVVPLENGIEAPEQLSLALGKQKVLGGLCRIISQIAAPGHIRHAGAQPYVAFAELDNSPSQRTKRLEESFKKAQGVSVEIPPDIQAAMWMKFLFISVMSEFGAITRAPAGVLRSQPELRRLIERALFEVLRVAEANKIPLPKDAVEKTMKFIDSLPPEATASLQRDVMAGRPSELEAQVGAIVRLADKIGIDAPVNRFIYHCLMPLEQRARGLLEF